MKLRDYIIFSGKSRFYIQLKSDPSYTKTILRSFRCSAAKSDEKNGFLSHYELEYEDIHVFPVAHIVEHPVHVFLTTLSVYYTILYLVTTGSDKQKVLTIS